MARVLAIALVLSVIISVAFCVPVAKGEKADRVEADFADHFTDDWRSIYNEERLSRQPKWKLAEEQPEDGTFQIREYERSWWVTSFTNCLDRSEAVQMNYFNLYFYINGYNYQRTHYPYTYPILTKIETQNGLEKRERKDRRDCPNKISQNLYLPISLSEYPASTYDESITEEIVPVRRYFVREYENDFSPERCDKEAVNLAIDLARNRRQFDTYTWYCAQYEPGESGKKGIFEVWIEDEQEQDSGMEESEEDYRDNEAEPVEDDSLDEEQENYENHEKEEDLNEWMEGTKKERQKIKNDRRQD